MRDPVKEPGPYRCAGNPVGRREFLRLGSLSLLGISLNQYLGLKSAAAADVALRIDPAAKAQSCILFWLEGAPSQMDTWDPKPNSTFKPISTNVDGIQISEIFPRVAQHMDKLAIIRSMHTKDPNHSQGTYETMTGHVPSAVMHFPSLGSVIAREKTARSKVPTYVMVNRPYEAEPFSYEAAFSAGFIGSEYNPLIIEDPRIFGNSKVDLPHEIASWADLPMPDLTLPKSISTEQIADRRSFLKVVDEHYRAREQMAEFARMDSLTRQALEMILSPEVKQAFDLSQESQKMKEAYGVNRVGQSALLARRLVERGCRFVTAAPYKTGQWDTHAKNDEMMRDTLGPSADQVISTLLEDLEQRGLLESTVVLVMGEFGRTPNINANRGRDHWAHCWSMVLGGGGIRGGQVIGASDERAAYVADRKVTTGDLFATIYKAFGIDWTKSYPSPVGRPIYIANSSLDDTHGEPIKELV